MPPTTRRYGRRGGARRVLLPPPEQKSSGSVPGNKAADDKVDDPLDIVLQMCKGEIVPNIPNLQLLHMMVVYGQCGGGEGLCVETLQGCQALQSRGYERYMRSLVATLSTGQSHNMQSMLVPNTWTDVMCKIQLDAEMSGMALVPSTSQEQLQQLQSFLLCMDAQCNGLCYELRMVDSPGMITRLSTSLTFCQDVDKAACMVRTWIRGEFSKWLQGFYECYSLACFEDGMRLPAPDDMGLSAKEFKDWNLVVHGIVHHRLRLLLEEHTRSAKDKEESVGLLEAWKMMRTAWRQAVFLQQDLTNMMLFYVGYVVRRRGEEFLRKKMQHLHGKVLPGYGKIFDALSVQDIHLANKISSIPPLHGGSLVSMVDISKKQLHALLLAPCSNLAWRSCVKTILECGCSHEEIRASQGCISLQLVQFAHSCMQVLRRDNGDALVCMQQAFAMDRAGIYGVANAMDVVSGYVGVMGECFSLINMDMWNRKDGVLSAHTSVSTLQCMQAFTELVQRMAHFKIFGTGKKHVVDASNMLLRTGGFPLAKKLLDLLNNSCETKSACVAKQTIADVLSAWVGIMMVTSVGNNDSSVVENAERDFLQKVKFLTDETHFGRVAHCIRDYVEQYLQQKSPSSSPVARASPVSFEAITEILGDSEIIEILESRINLASSRGDSSRMVLDVDDDRDNIPLPLVPQMYLGSTSLQPASFYFGRATTAAGDSSVEDEESVSMFFDASVPRRLDSEMCHAFDHCWRMLANGSNEGMTLALFCPLLMQVAQVARNVIKCNALYSMEFIVRPL